MQTLQCFPDRAAPPPLRQIRDTPGDVPTADARASFLGEIARDGVDSPVFAPGLLFDDVILNENAASHMIDIADSIHPGFRDALEEVEVATPLTHMNYLEIEVLSKYGNDFTDRRGTVKATVDLYHPKELKLRVSAIINETPSTKTIFVCGPEAMYSFCLKELEALGLRKKQIRVEAYGPPGDVTAEPGWPEGLSGDAKFKVKISDGRTLEVRAGEPLICSLERHHLALPAGCRSGECSYCRAKLLSGTVFHAQGTGLRKSDLQFGYIHPCMAYPIEDLEIRADFR